MSDDLRAYLRELMALPTLQPFQLTCLFEEAELGGPQAELARRRLAEVHLRLAVGVARKYTGQGLPLQELIEASNLGLIRAVDKYNFPVKPCGVSHVRNLVDAKGNRQSVG